MLLCGGDINTSLFTERQSAKEFFFSDNNFVVLYGFFFLSMLAVI
jgi:hypothetical protein